MARIMCTQKLWKSLEHPGRPPAQSADALIAGIALGNWAATVFRFDRHDLVLALNERTYLTLVFPLTPRAGFRVNLGCALGGALEDLGLPKNIVCAETLAAEFAEFARLTDRTVSASLHDLEFFCGIELAYHDDLRRVQLNLNEVPHPNREPCTPREAVAALYAAEAALAGASAVSH